MANNSQDTSNSYNNITIPIQPQQVQPRDKIQQSSLELEKRQKRMAQNAHKRKSMTLESERERDKQKAELEKSGNELKSLIAQFGTKAKVADEIDNDAKKLRNNIEALMAKVHAKVNKPIQITPPPPPPQISQVSQISQMPQLSALEQEGLVTSIWNNLLYIILFPFNLIINLLRKLYYSVNWTVLLSCILLIELIIIGLIWTVRQNQYTYAYVEPYEAVVHGTYGLEPDTWGISSAVNSIHDFIAEVMKGGRGFGSPSYDGFVPI